ncbi:MAG: 8-amino-7-oxononanoate synthase [Thermodesulfobacteriota bacterium]|jgi:8-amino-7-oxononanoate synthase|nr:MAG: 8-amino-7-oxononanoate synthase [Thermodesulfobacteriota bacterium]
MEDFLLNALKKTDQEGLYRTLQSLETAQSPVVVVGGKRVIQFSSNNYLGLTNHPALKRAAQEAIERYGVGTGASRLIAGNLELYEQLEKNLARFKGTESAIVFPTGYQTNVGTISALMGEKDLIFSDALNHASIVDGCRLCGAKIIIYPHRDLDALEQLIKTAPQAKNRMIITDGVFSVDGTIAPLPGLVELAGRYGCWLMVDEAHATGVLGNRGRGTAEHFGVEKGVDIHMGTFSKALGSLGGYVAGSKNLIDFLINKSRSLIYTTGLPPSVVAVNRAALELVENGLDLRKALWERVGFFRNELNRLGFNTFSSEAQIIPVIIGDPVKTMDVFQYLFSRGVLAYGVRPPTVPEGLSRIRIAVMATHGWDDLYFGLQVLEEAGKRFGII